MVTTSLYDDVVSIPVEVAGAIRERLALAVARFSSTTSGGESEPAASGRRFVLLHGNPAHLDHWSETVPFLRTHGEVLALDLPGFGRSDAPRGTLSLDLVADATVALLDALGWRDPVHLLGQSHGGAVAHTIAARHPERVRTAVLLGTMGVPAHRSMRLAMLPGVASLTYGIARRMDRWLYRAVAGLVARGLTDTAFHPDPVPPGFREREQALVAARPEVQRSSVRACAGDPTRQLLVQSPRVRAPLLFVHGRDDRLVPIAHARRLFDATRVSSPESRFAPVAGGHMVHMTSPALVHSLLDEWLTMRA